MNLLIEIIFKGVLSSVNFNFLKDLVMRAKELYFNSPEISSVKTFDEVIEILNANAYIDLVLNTDELKIYNKDVPKVFINLGRNYNDIELLFFFDLQDLNDLTVKESVDCLMDWTTEFKNNYKFDYFICRADNAGDGEYYFDSQGTGSLYNITSS
ncbi:MAG: hypothetical protein J7539_16185 [Niabella sp.]|nr:hypothetical protein [Niabella sp.]